MTDLELYALAVLDGKILACDKIKKLYEKLLYDLHNPGQWHFDEDKATRPVRFIEQFCKQSQGKIGEPLRLELYQKAMLEAAYGFLDDNDLRRYQEILNIIARKNGKKNIETKARYGKMYVEENPAQYEYVASKNEAFAKKYVLDEATGKVVKRK